ncbi:MAG TPA: PGPGW domain-containing protein [Acidimicrobiales bacterium]
MGWVGQVLRTVVRTARRLGIFLVGTGIIVLGIVLIPLPGPGWAIVIAGVAVWATEFTWAERLLRFVKRHASKATGVALDKVTALQRFGFLRRFADRDHDGTSDVVDLLQPEPLPNGEGRTGEGDGDGGRRNGDRTGTGHEDRDSRTPHAERRSA